jgi:hypothetical protein
MSRVDFGSPMEVRMQDIYQNPDEFLPVEACEPGTIYWGNAAKFGQVALCKGIDDDGRMLATGIEEERGVYRLVDEIHHDSWAEHRKGTWMPHVAIGRIDEGLRRVLFVPGNTERSAISVDETSLFDLLLQTEIEVTEDKIDWLKALPEALQSTQNHADYLDLNRANLKILQRVQKFGPESQKLPGVADILAAHKTAVSI